MKFLISLAALTFLCTFTTYSSAPRLIAADEWDDHVGGFVCCQTDGVSETYCESLPGDCNGQLSFCTGLNQYRTCIGAGACGGFGDCGLYTGEDCTDLA